MIDNWNGVAFNQVPNSRNEIHGDKVAKDYGFKGGLVPGVTVSAYLLHPAAVSFGLDYLEQGFAHIRVNSPLYDEETFERQIQDQHEQGYSACLVREDGTLSATAEVRIETIRAEPPRPRGDKAGDKEATLIPATRENMQTLQATGCKSFTYRWNAEHDMSTYLSDRSSMADVFSRDGYANPSFVLGISNWVLAANAHMNPWVHMETRSQNYAAIPQGTKVLGEMQITDLFEKKGHEFVDSTINLFGAAAGKCFSSIQLRAIYRLRGL